jgi:hypothetical protein
MQPSNCCYANKAIATGIWYTLICLGNDGDAPSSDLQGMTMAKTVAIALPAQTTLFQRFLALVDEVLMASAQAAVRNGEPTYFGL